MEFEPRVVSKQMKHTADGVQRSRESSILWKLNRNVLLSNIKAAVCFKGRVNKYFFLSYIKDVLLERSKRT